MLLRQIWNPLQNHVIRELFGCYCAFCGGSILFSESGNALCRSCAVEAQTHEGSLPFLQIQGGLEIYSLLPYEGWFKKAILLNKRNPHPIFTAWAAKLALQTLRGLLLDFRRTSLYWVPGSAFEPTHLVEAQAHHLAQSGLRLAHRNLMQRKMQGAAKLHFSSSREERLKAVAKKFAFEQPRAPFRLAHHINWILIDDVCTTGFTIQHLHHALHRQLGTPAQFALTLAFTPRS